MALESFHANSLVVPVRAGLSMEVVDEGKLAALREAAGLAMKAAGCPGLAAELMRRMLSQRLDDDLWYSCLPDGTTVVLIKELVYRQLPEREIVEHVHKAEIEAAARRGEPVHEELLRYYRQKPPPVLAPGEA